MSETAPRELRFDMDFGDGRAIYTRAQIAKRLEELRALKEAQQEVDYGGKWLTAYDTSTKEREST